MKGKELCTCISFKCKDDKTSDGRTGCLVDTRTLTKHHRADDSALLASHAVASQNRALAIHEDELAESVSGLTIEEATSHPAAAVSPLPPIMFAPDLPSYKHQRQLFILHEIENRLLDLRKEMHAVVYAPAKPSNDSLIEKMEALQNLQLALREDSMRLRSLSTIKTPAIMESHILVKAARDDLENDLDSMQLSWQRVVDRRVAEPLRMAESVLDTSDHFILGFSDIEPFQQLVVIMAMVCHVVLHLPRRGTYWLFAMCEKIIETILMPLYLLRHLIPANLLKVLDHFPREIRTAMKPLRLEGKFEVYAACPKCHATYRPIASPAIPGEGKGSKAKKQFPVYQKHCTAERHGTTCEELLLRPKSIGGRRLAFYVPIRPYIYFDFED
ncbi:hypothetical protein DXG01_011449, partial [Tephrocybe rancida]